MTQTQQLVHGCCFHYEGIGVLLTGESGIGKTGLMLSMLERGAKLVADDQVLLSLGDNKLLASAPASLKGIVELSGLAVVEMNDVLEQTAVDIHIHLTAELTDRIADLDKKSHFLGTSILQLELYAQDSHLPQKLSHFLTAWREGRIIDTLPVASGAKSA